MSENKELKAAELNAESLEKVDGGFKLNDLIQGFDNEPKAETLPTGGRSFKIESAIATGEKIADQTPMRSETVKKTGKKIPKIIFRDKGKSI